MTDAFSTPDTAILAQIQREVARQVQRLAPAAPATNAAGGTEMGATMPPLGWGEVMTFGHGGTGSFLLREGWSVPETDFVWSDGPSASLQLPLQSDGTDVLLDVEATPFTDASGEQLVRVVADGSGIGIWTMRKTGRFHAIIPAPLLARRREVRLTFQVERPVSPQQLGRGQDPRKLGLALRRLEARPF